MTEEHRSAPVGLDADCTAAGERMHRLATELFPIHRSLTGDGVRKTLEILRRELPALRIHEVPSGTKCFDWDVPPEWNIHSASLIAPDGQTVVDIKDHTLHVVGYSEPVDREVEWDELQEHLFSIPDQPTAIPYITSYYRRFWGFCLSHDKRRTLRPGRYRVKIDSTLEAGALTYADLVLPGRTTKEVLLSTYVCHPSMANNELSGPVLAVALAQWLAAQPQRELSYRIVFVPETIGAIAYLSRNLDAMKRHTYAGFQLTCVGDERAYSYLPSRQGDSVSDRAALHVLRRLAPDFVRYSFLDRGSDERQYCSPGVDLPVASVMRSKYAKYPEYHTSLDDLAFVTPRGLAGAYAVHTAIIRLLESNRRYRVTTPCEPQLGKRGLYPSITAKGLDGDVQALNDLLAYADGTCDLIGLCDKIGVFGPDLVPILKKLLDANLLEPIDSDS